MSATPRILIVEFLPSGGMFQFAHQMAVGLAEAGARVTLLTGPRPELSSEHPRLRVRETLPTWHPNDPVSSPRSRFRSFVRRGWRAVLLTDSWRRVLQEVRASRPDIVQFGELRYDLDRIGLLAVARLGGARVVDVAHNPLPYDVHNTSAGVEKSGRIGRWTLDRAYRACWAILTLGEGPRRQLLDTFPSVGRVAVIGHGRYEAFGSGHEQWEPAPDAPAELLFFGALTRYKNLPLLLDAFELLRRTRPEARLTIAGAPMPDVDVEALRQRAETIGAVDLRIGYVPAGDIPELFLRSRAVVAPYSVVNISGVVHLAFTFARPVVATDVGAMGDVVENGVTGFLCPPEAESLAAAMREVIDHPRAAERMGSAAAHHLQTEFSWAAVARRALAAYDLPAGLDLGGVTDATDGAGPARPTTVRV